MVEVTKALAGATGAAGVSLVALLTAGRPALGATRTGTWARSRRSGAMKTAYTVGSIPGASVLDARRSGFEAAGWTVSSKQGGTSECGNFVPGARRPNSTVDGVVEQLPSKLRHRFVPCSSGCGAVAALRAVRHPRPVRRQ